MNTYTFYVDTIELGVTAIEINAATLTEAKQLRKKFIKTGTVIQILENYMVVYFKSPKEKTSVYTVQSINQLGRIFNTKINATSLNDAVDKIQSQYPARDIIGCSKYKTVQEYIKTL